MRAVLAIAVLTSLWVAGCSAGVPSDTGASGGALRGFLGKGTSSLPLSRASLAGGDVRLSGPAGYCIDPETLQVGSSQSFALLASCRILSDGAGGPDVEPVLISVTVGARGSGIDLPEPKTLAEVAHAPLLEGHVREGLSLALLARGGDSAFDGGDPRYWRGAFVQGGRLIGLALYVPRGSTVLPQRGADMLQSLSAQVRSDSPKPSR
ncbi:dihydroxy-acid dehydratase [Puniceibacterium confluentis]|uniref:dihydroxy-acid dehydratase n=1 Tax=Puniceibacterium confluentis TaxID=1958944 RepID=UPI0011B5224A|nr:dihydroxy-acid dehydratase [Puniceibacterium confluentis]